MNEVKREFGRGRMKEGEDGRFTGPLGRGGGKRSRKMQALTYKLSHYKFFGRMRCMDAFLSG